MMKKFFVLTVTVLMMASCALAMPIDDIANISVNADGSNFQYWNENAASLQALKAYISDVTDPQSPNFIPVEDRICVSDMDGTLYSELAPTYAEWYMFFHRIYDDPTYTPNATEKAFADECLKAAKSGKIATDLDSGEDHSQSYAFEGMTLDEFDDYSEKFLRTTPLDGLSNCTFGEAFYLPMVEVIRYLQANGFTFYVVTGADRQLARVILRAVPSVRPNNVIGTDSNPIARRQGFSGGLYFQFESEDVMMRGPFIWTMGKMAKVSHIAREIGIRPVMALGNSSGDGSMLNYARFNPKYRGFAMGVLCDDTERDWGNVDSAASFGKMCDHFGWEKISMRDDWKTIYGDGVEKTERKFRK